MSRKPEKAFRRKKKRYFSRGVMFLLCLIPLYFYPLNEKKAEEILGKLQDMNKEEK